MTYTTEQILERARELAQMIAESEEVETFKQAEAKINENQTVRETIASIKSLQKQAVNFQQYGKERALAQTEEKIATYQAKIDDLPVVQQFKETQADVNDLLQLVAATISNAVTDEIIRSTGGDVLRGETGSKVANAPGGSCS